MAFKGRRNYRAVFRAHAGNRIARFLYTRLKHKYRSVGTQTETVKKKVRSGGGITNQYDKKLVYSKKRMPYKKRKRWVKFIKKVNAVDERELGTRTVVFNKQGDFANTIPGKQAFLSVALYPRSSTNAWANDLEAIYDAEAAGTATTGGIINRTTKFLFHSGILDITCRNVSYNNSDSATPVVPVEMDAYEIICKKELANEVNNFNTLTGAIQNVESDIPPIAGAGISIQLEDRGVTPWDLPLALSVYGMKILKKTKYFLGPGQTMTYQMRDPKRHQFTGQQIAEGTGCNQPKATRWVLFIAKAVPGYTIGVAGNEHTEQVKIGFTRKYMYKIEGFNDSRDNYVINP